MIKFILKDILDYGFFFKLASFENKIESLITFYHNNLSIPRIISMGYLVLNFEIKFKTQE